MPRLPVAVALVAAAFLTAPAAEAAPVCFDSRRLADDPSLYYSGCTELKEQWDGGYCLHSVGTVAGRPYRITCPQ